MLPKNIILIRHGESEGNLVLDHLLKNDFSLYTDEFKNRHECDYRLTENGVNQAKRANEFLKENFQKIPIDLAYTSDFIRAKETASYLDVVDGKKWKIASILTERDWGDFRNLTPKEINERYPKIMNIKKTNPLDWRPPNGENIRDVILRIRHFLDILHRQHSLKNILIVCHGEVIHAFKIILEDLNQLDYYNLENSKNIYDKINNCQIIHYSRINPETNEESKSIKWFRSICPWDLNLSSNNWCSIDKKLYSTNDLKNMVQKFKPLF